MKGVSSPSPSSQPLLKRRNKKDSSVLAAPDATVGGPGGTGAPAPRARRRYGPSSIRFRLTMYFVAVLAVTMLVFGGILYAAFVRSQKIEFDTALYNHALDLAGDIRLTLFGSLSVGRDVLDDQGKMFPFRVGKSFVQIASLDGDVILGSRTLGRFQLPIYTADLSAVRRDGGVFRTIDGTEIFRRSPADKTQYRLLSMLVERPGSMSFILQIAVPMNLAGIKGVKTFLFVGIPSALVLAALGGFFIAGRALAPVNTIIRSSRKMTARSLGERLPVPEANDELRDLSLTLNGLLDRLQQAFDSQERFVADASHQLKTPLAILRGELDLLRKGERNAAEISEFIESATQELGFLSRMVDDLLLLARMDVGGTALAKSHTRMDEIALEAVSRLEKVAREKNVRIRFDLDRASESQAEPAGEFELDGDPDLLRSMLHSLIENAIKFASPGTPVEVTVRDEPDTVAASVKNFGPVIPSALLARIFERFYRAPDADTASKSPKPQGYGLGLAIAHRIAQVHGGSISATSSELDGTVFTARIKKV